MTTYPLFYAWKLTVLWGPAGSPFFGRRCRMVARGALNSRMVEFEDGSLQIVSGNSLRKGSVANDRRSKLMPSLSEIRRNASHGGKREGAGRKHTGPLCACGKHSNKRAQALRLKCRIEPYLK